jgi:hypothetical protein
MIKNKIIAIYMVVGLVLMMFAFSGDYYIHSVSGAPNDNIDGYQEHHGHWTVTGNEEYSHEIIALYGDLTIQGGGHLILNNCTLMMMSAFLQPYDILVEDGGTLEMYDCYVTDPPDDDDTEVLSAWYYFIARAGSTLIVENSTIRQCGFIDPENPEHIGVSVSTTSGHISNTTLNTSISGLTFFGNNTGFYAENITLSQIGMNGILLVESQGAKINNTSFSGIGEDRVIDIQGSSGFIIENSTLSGGQHFQVVGSSDFIINNIVSQDSERVLEFESSDSFEVRDITIYGAGEFNNGINVKLCSHFIIDNIIAQDDYNTIRIEDSSYGTASNINANHIQRIIDVDRSDYIEISDMYASDGSDVMYFKDSNQIKIENVDMYNVSRPLDMEATNDSQISNLTIKWLVGYGPEIRANSNNVSISNWYIEANTTGYTRGLQIESSSASISDYEAYNTTLGLYSFESSITAENFFTDGMSQGDKGIELYNRDGVVLANNIILSNLTILNYNSFGILVNDHKYGNVTIDNTFIDNVADGVRCSESNITLTNLFVGSFTGENIWAHDNSFVVVMNSTLNDIRLTSSEIIFINSTNTSVADVDSFSSLTWKWWVDVHVEDKIGPVAGATVDIEDNTFIPEISSITQSDGFARNLPVTQCIWNPSYVSMNPHRTKAYGDGWGPIWNFTLYMVNNNMQVNITYNKNVPPNIPDNLLAESLENSSTLLSWDPSTSTDVIGYRIYIAKDSTSLDNYLALGAFNATATECNYVHVSGSEDWQEYFYAVRPWDGENESFKQVKASCGDWVVNITSPQSVDGLEIDLWGSLLVYGSIELSNTTLYIYSAYGVPDGIMVNDSASFKGENISVEWGKSKPYYFYIGEDADVYINNSFIQRPGTNNPDGYYLLKGIYSCTNNLTITNTTISVEYRGLGIFHASDFQGKIYNVSFYAVPSFNFQKADILLNISHSSGIEINNCSFGSESIYGIYAHASTDISVYDSYIQMEKTWGDDHRWGVYLSECKDWRIHNNSKIFGSPAVYVLNSENVAIETSNISAPETNGIHGESSTNITVWNCNFESGENEPRWAIYMSWCVGSVIEDMSPDDVSYFLKMENESQSVINNININNGENGIWIVYSEYIYINNTYISFMFNGMVLMGCREVFLFNTTINLTFYGLQIKSPGPVYLINSTMANGIAAEVIAEGFEGELGSIYMENSTIVSISDTSLKLDNSAVVYLINTSFNLTKLQIADAASRVELYHYLSIQVYNIDNLPPVFANITIFNVGNGMVYDKQVSGGFAEYILIHEKTVFKEDEYSDNPHQIFVDDGSHYGSDEAFINETGHLDVYVQNELPWISFVEIYGLIDLPDPFPDQKTYLPVTNLDIVLDYTYEDPENDPESGTIILWFVNGLYNSTFTGMQTISYTYTTKYQTWQAIVYPADGYDSTYPTYPYQSNVILIINTPPEVNNVVISPSDPTGGDDLYVSYNVYDLDGDGLDSSKTAHKWYYYNETVGDWVYSNIDNYYLDSQFISKGQRWRCEVTPHDGDNEGLAMVSQEVLIGNTPPSIQNQKIVAESGETTITSMDNLKVEYDFIDDDNDQENGSTFEWYIQRDGGNWTLYNVNSSILPNTYTKSADLWMCRIIPSDGTENGPEVWTDAVEIFNTPPIASNATILPQYATSSDTLQITYDFWDFDGDEDNGTSFRWVYEDALGVWESGIKGNETPAGIIKKEQTWYCFVIPSDGMSVGAEIKSEGLLIHNSPPTLEEAYVTIQSDDESRWLTINYSMEDIDGDTVQSIEVIWIHQGLQRSEFNNLLTISEENLFKGESWEASIRASDGEEWSGWFSTTSINIPNTPPYIDDIPTLKPPRALSNQNLTPEFQSLFQDIDGDSLDSWEIKWYKDNGHMEAYDDEDHISWDLTEKGEIWYYKVRVSDGEGFSEWYSSTTSIIENSPPSNITLNPEGGEIVIEETDTAEFYASSKDMDDEDVLSYRWTLDGRIVLLEEGVSTSIYFMKTDYDSEGEYILRLVITDGDDFNETTWTISVLKKNRLPEITVVEPEGRSATIKELDSLNFAITKSDPDGDSLDVRWYLDGTDGTPVWEGSDKYTYNPDYYSSGSHNITAEVYEKDSGAYSRYSWDVEVKDVEEGAMSERFLGLPWDVWSIIIEVIVIGGSGLLAFIGYSRLRKKKGALKVYMAEIDEISSEELAPEDYDAKFDELEERINNEFREGKIEDLHFLMLQELIATRRSEVRKAEVSRKFEKLPEGIMEELDEMLQDGKISKEEYEGFVTTISKTKTLTSEEKKELSDMIERWEEEDKDSMEDIGKGEESVELEDEIDEELGEELDDEVIEEEPEPKEEDKDFDGEPDEEPGELTEEETPKEETSAKSEKKKKSKKWGRKKD